MTLKQKLVLMGVTEHEAEVYGALLQVDTVKVLDLTEMVRLPRPNIYIALQKLRKRGMVTVGKGKVSQYSAVPPEIAFRCILETDEHVRRSKQEILTELLQMFADRKTGPPKPHAIEVLGSDQAGFAQLKEQVIHTRHEILTIFGNPKRMFNGADPVEVDATELAALERGVRIRCLYSIMVIGQAQEWSRAQQLLPAGEVGRVSEELPVNMILLDDVMALLQLPDGNGRFALFRINDPNLIRLLKFGFEQVWTTAMDIDEFFRIRDSNVTAQAEASSEA